MAQLIFPELSYKIVGAVFDVYNELGFGYQEKYYYRAVKEKLRKLQLQVKEQLYTPLLSDGKPIGSYFLDFLIDGKVVLELKVANQIYPKHIKQVLGYLSAHNLNLGLLAVFTKGGVRIKRIIH